MANKAIIGLEDWDAMQARAMAAATAFDAGEPVATADYHLSFATAEQLFAALTPARLTLIDSLKRAGGALDAELSGRIGRDRTAVESDLAALIDLGLVVRDEDGKVRVPWSEVQLHLSLSGRAAA
jgi:predicted transcriptional regulator